MIVINYSPGGYYADFDRVVQESIVQNQVVVINGECYSACTMFLRNPNTCVTAHAKLAFHAFRYASGKQDFNLSLTKRYIRSLPLKTRIWIARQGGLGSGEWRVLEGEKLLKVVKQCPDVQVIGSYPRLSQSVVNGFVEPPPNLANITSPALR